MIAKDEKISPVSNNNQHITFYMKINKNKDK